MSKIGNLKHTKNKGWTANLKDYSPGVKVDANYTPGKDKVLDATLKKLQGNPNSLNKSGFSPVQRVKKKTKKNTRTT